MLAGGCEPTSPWLESALLYKSLQAGATLPKAALLQMFNKIKPFCRGTFRLEPVGIRGAKRGPSEKTTMEAWR